MKRLKIAIAFFAFKTACYLPYANGLLLREISWNGVVHLQAPGMAALDRDGNVYIVDKAMMRVLKVGPLGHMASQI